jgi:hypothetical protein
MSRFYDRICPAVQSELDASAREEDRGNTRGAFLHLERAHVLGQITTAHHVRAHWLMLRWALRHRQPREAVGQLTRIVGAATKTALGWVPQGNTGGSNVSPFQRMPIPAELQQQLEGARRH